MDISFILMYIILPIIISWGLITGKRTKNHLRLTTVYDEKGIDRFLTLLKKTDYSMRNFSYTSDLALEKYTESEQYKSLREKESAIKIHRMNGIDENIYGKIDDFCYKFVVSKAKMKNLTEQECLNELEKSSLIHCLTDN